MDESRSAAGKRLEFRTRLRPGMGQAYESFHSAVPAEVHQAIHAAGVTEWQIFRHRDVLTHKVVAADEKRLRTELDPNPVNVSWQRQVDPYIQPNEAPAPVSDIGVLIWDLSWPPRN